MKKQDKLTPRYYMKYCCWCGGIFKLHSDDREVVHTESKFPNRLLRPSKISGRLVKDGICGGCKNELLKSAKGGE